MCGDRDNRVQNDVEVAVYPPQSCSSQTLHLVTVTVLSPCLMPAEMDIKRRRAPVTNRK